MKILLQNATVITNITKCDSCYKMRRLLQIATVHVLSSSVKLDCSKNIALTKVVSASW